MSKGKVSGLGAWVLAAALASGCGGVTEGGAPDAGGGGASAGRVGAAAGTGGGGHDGAQAAGAPGEGGGGAGGEPGIGDSGGGGGVGSATGATAGASGTAPAGSAGAAGADAGAGGTGGDHPWCLDPYPASAPPSCGDVNVPQATSDPTTRDCAGLPTRTVPVFGKVTCMRCSTSSGHSLDQCLATWQSLDGGSTCAYPMVLCVLSCSECP